MNEMKEREKKEWISIFAQLPIGILVLTDQQSIAHCTEFMEDIAGRRVNELKVNYSL